MKLQVVSVGLLLALTAHTIYGACQRPSLEKHSYSLTINKTTYTTGDTFEVACKSGFSMSGESILHCQASGSWDPSAPTCSDVSGMFTWWMLLIMVVGGILLLTCVLSRIIWCCCKKNKDKKQGRGAPKPDKAPLHRDF